MQHIIKGAPSATIKATENNRATLKLIYENENSTSLETISTNDTILCTHSIPLHISIPEFLAFITPVEPHVSHYRVIRPFSSLDPETCQILYVEFIEMNTARSQTLFSLMNMEETCSVCLEPLDENKSGILTIFCQHTFHCHCLLKWRDGSCPVCRYSQKKIATTATTEDAVTSSISKLDQEAEERTMGPGNDDENECAECKTKDNLWICLICGHVGCGRYQTAHAYEHFSATDHVYALEITSQRVWDYASDGYVHRLIQNVADGKLVELPDNNTTDQSSQVTTFCRC
ncbi:hypothetical protein RO3G_09790 [Rhizopus delemar RA 99-880]|uniref:RING-type domain-containing protein n=1 Tax=Rhizopus delemar (strain RA 99-880 / ATCC MYA-4621 / FGSC 9543 / NRRL 43880) TaxID=246409 RepID=I1C9F0_RHIO9|nr:hypothetical protein RO3G_09790 [Rhizopus delemar RA 99-880]|eukprot:EIE85080.1 hypothetical protein RO3G_09790 [Rhizopus delemar RA 99-880]